ncbi:circumsporozoite protein-like [Canis lupus dingo]|uniref:circumsporozoite protein-like n=1 Tax=Canis lupus dingo TaxID=286419 RepID=UPI0003AE3DB1|nr:circumsporozoite protein-like [Canis lupus dingo]
MNITLGVPPRVPLSLRSHLPRLAALPAAGAGSREPLARAGGGGRGAGAGGGETRRGSQRRRPAPLAAQSPSGTRPGGAHVHGGSTRGRPAPQRPSAEPKEAKTTGREKRKIERE